jgi:hypothetical protein
MQRRVPFRRWCVVTLGALLTGIAWPIIGQEPTVNGQARAVHASVSGIFGSTTTTLSDTGTLSESSDVREASQPTGNVPGLLTVATLHATTIGGPDQVSSEASVANLSLAIAGTTITADFVMSSARAVSGAAGAGSADFDGLSINGLPITVSGEPNQTIAIPGGRVVINEQQTSAGRAVVNALRVAVSGVANIVVASATAEIH